MYGFENVADRARSNVRPIPDIAMSNLSAARSATTEPNVIFTYSILTPRADPSASSASMSKPCSFPVAGSRMLNHRRVHGGADAQYAVVQNFLQPVRRLLLCPRRKRNE